MPQSLNQILHYTSHNFFCLLNSPRAILAKNLLMFMACILYLYKINVLRASNSIAYNLDSERIILYRVLFSLLQFFTLYKINVIRAYSIAYNLDSKRIISY